MVTTLQSMKDLSGQIVNYNLHALHTFVVSIQPWLVCAEAESNTTAKSRTWRIRHAASPDVHGLEEPVIQS